MSNITSILAASSSPHKKTSQTTRSIMLDVCIALLPACVMGCIYFGWEALFVLVLSVVSAVATEFVWLFAAKKKWSEIVRQFDFSSCVTGLLLGMCLHSKTDWYVAVLAAVFAVAAVKMFFGGTGKNIVNPAIAGRVFAFIAFPVILTGGYAIPAFAPDFITTGATPLSQIGQPDALSAWQLFLGIGVQGTIGETCKAALLLGYVYLIIRRVLDWKFPILTIGSCGLVAVALNGFDFTRFLPSILTGGLFLGAIFMATDYVTSPKTQLGSILYFIALGALIAVLREGTGIEVVSFAILLMNFAVPLIDRYIRPKPFGYQKPQKEGNK